MYDFKPQEVTFKFKCGQESCFYEKGKPCFFLETRRFGTEYNCGLFEKQLDQNEDGVIARCDECLKLSTE